VSVLADILASKRAEIARLRGDPAAPDLPASGRSPLDAARALRRPQGEALRILAEVKFKSPSAGALSRALDAGARAVAYARAGASMVSVLCDGPFFDGGWSDLSRARAALDAAGSRVPLLAKEFVLDEVQLDRARAAGADAVLLIARIVDARQLAELHAAARARGLWPMVEVVDEEELAAALAAGARIVGVNARDLDTLVMDAPRAARVLSKIPEGCVRVHLSGIKGPADLRAVAAGPADAVLVGEVLMREADPEPTLQALVDAAR
jgi:indole-3-glycerol phosphate synthase